MTTIKRFTPDYKMHAVRFEAFAREAEHGEFVKFSDYESLVSELASSRQINAQTLQVKLTMAEAIKELTARVNALAVENAALKAINDDRRMFIMNGVQLGYIKVPTVEVDPALETIRIAVSPQAPTIATDAALAAIEARAKVEAIELLIGRKKRELADMHPDTHAFGMTSALIRNHIRCLESFAAEMREAK
ncbi:hypothetical protein LG59_5041 [Serratia ureilytica]|uniref:hypothetical protein n=1 Tax=Serratia ureilytica TaxID=300181 RepID=UPI000633FE06|nr:hypothetical protein [Serratia ureilytica]KKO56535.1 hypothetical protein LG59_5094 [Serratia ureilytica]KKO60478.1 hypothetical protein LG59_5041 [Serratia ureilytica]